ncbi:hypothetical protein JCM19233_7515 [Vibrio astriarenae]|nr:hypothetical protein JCM19233_7515 [Vibrio sp. C7]
MKGLQRKVLDILLQVYPNKISAEELKAKLKANSPSEYYSALRNATIFVDVNSRTCESSAEKYHVLDKHIVQHHLSRGVMGTVS